MVDKEGYPWIDFMSQISNQMQRDWIWCAIFITLYETGRRRGREKEGGKEIEREIDQERERQTDRKKELYMRK